MVFRKVKALSTSSGPLRVTVPGLTCTSTSSNPSGTFPARVGFTARLFTWNRLRLALTDFAATVTPSTVLPALFTARMGIWASVMAVMLAESTSPWMRTTWFTRVSGPRTSTMGGSGTAASVRKPSRASPLNTISTGFSCSESLSMVTSRFLVERAVTVRVSELTLRLIRRLCFPAPDPSHPLSGGYRCGPRC